MRRFSQARASRKDPQTELLENTFGPRARESLADPGLGCGSRLESVSGVPKGSITWPGSQWGREAGASFEGSWGAAWGRCRGGGSHGELLCGDLMGRPHVPPSCAKRKAQMWEIKNIWNPHSSQRPTVWAAAIGAIKTQLWRGCRERKATDGVILGSRLVLVLVWFGLFFLVTGMYPAGRRREEEEGSSSQASGVQKNLSKSAPEIQTAA